MVVNGEPRARHSALWAWLAVLALMCGSPAARAENGASLELPRSEHEPEGPQRLAITVIADDAVIATFQQRVSSWFEDGTLVSVRARSDLEAQQLLSAAPGEVSAWIVPRSPERALVIFASGSTRAGARYLLREVRLRSGLDDLGLERLASVIHSAFVALREGEQGFEREQAERELRELGLAPPAPSPSVDVPVAPLPTPSTPVPSARVPAHRFEPRATGQRVAVLLAAGYGARWRGAEGVGHGPSVAVGLELPHAVSVFELWASAHFLLPSSFQAGSFDTSLQTTALRVRAGLAPALAASYRLQALAGAGADLARLHTSAREDSSPSNVSTVPRQTGAQWRGAGELSLGVVRTSASLELALSAQVTFLFADVHYSVVSDGRERRLSTPWPVQPSLSLAGRFRSAW